MYFLNEITPMKLMKKQTLLPINMKDKKKGSMIYLLGPNYESSINMTKIPMFLNRSLSFQSYYVDKNVSYYINNKNYLQESVDINNSENILYPDQDIEEDMINYCESISNISNSNILNDRFNQIYIESDTLSSKERKELPDKVFGLPKERKYPIHDKKHVLLAIKFFNHCDDANREELANNINKAIDKLFDNTERKSIHVGKNNAFSKYWTSSDIVNEYSENNILESINIKNCNTLIFDMGCVLIKDIPFERLKNDFLAKYKIKTEDLDLMFGSYNKLFKDMTYETVSAENFKIIFKATLPERLKKYADDFFYEIATCVEPYDYSEPLLKHLKESGYKLYYLSNWSKRSFELCKDKGIFDLLKYFDGGVFSYEIGLSKPNENIYTLLLSKYNINPKQAIFFDDKKENIDAANKLGIHGIQFSLDTVKDIIELKSLTERLESRNGIFILEHAEEIGVRSRDYNLVSLDDFTLESYILETDDLESNTTNPENLSDHLEKIPYIPEMNSAEDVINAIKSFNLVPKQVQRDVAEVIFKAAEEYGVDIKITSDNNLYKYNIIRTAKDHIESDKESEEINYRPTFSSNDYEATNEYFRGRNYITFFPDAYLTEDGKYDAQLRKLLYNERLKTNKDVFAIYNQAKQDNPLIKKTYSNLKLYKGLNLFVDLSYYTEVFFKNNFWKADRAVDLYFDFTTRLINDSRYDQYGYKVKTIFIPVNDWNKNPNVDLWDHRKTLNPISMIVRMAKRFPELLQEQLKDFNVIFVGEKTYFKVDFSKFDRAAVVKFITLIKRIINKDTNTDDMNEPDIDSKNVIVATIVDKLETSGKANIKINNLVGGEEKVSEEDIKKRKQNQISSNDVPKTTDKKRKQDTEKEVQVKEKKTSKQNTEKASEELIDTIKKAAEVSSTVDTAIETLDTNDSAKIDKIIDQLSSEETNNIKMTAARSSRILKLEKDLEKKSIKGHTVKNLIEKSEAYQELPETAVPIDSINEEWQKLKYTNFNKTYDINADIVAILNSFSKKSSPISVRDIKVENTSTSEDLLETWTVTCEDYKGQRFTLKFDIPLFIDNRFMKLRGNMKAIQGQLMLLPIIKTDQDTCQIVSNYNKIFIRRTNTNTGKSNCTADKIIKALLKGKYKNIKITEWDNSKISNKYELPIDYIDFSSVFDKIEINSIDDKKTFVFNQDELRRNYKYDLSKGLPVGYVTKMGKDTIIYYNHDNNMTFSQFLLSYLISNDNDFFEMYKSIKSSSKYTYTACSILNTVIPTVVVMAYSEGLTNTLNKSNIKFQLKEKRDRSLEIGGYDFIKFSDGYLYYEDTYIGSLLLNGLKECDTDNYSLGDINSKSMWVSFLDYFGGRIKADGLDNFYDLMMDPMTVSVCKDYNLPTDYVSALAYANMLLADNKYNRHVDISGNKFRTNEIIAGYVYRALAKAYGDYKNQLKRTSRASMTMKQSAVIDLLMIDPTMADASILSPLLEMETSNAVTFKGLSGMNSERSYGLDKRTFDDSMTNVLAMSTGFAGNVGITRQTTIDMNVDNSRGYIKGSKEDMGSVKSLCMTEALTPFGTTHDDPFRSAMTFIQTSKHSMRVRHASPALITNGADQALPYLTTDIFAHKAKSKGKVKELTEDYMIVEYDNKTSDFIDLRERVEKNSDGGFYVTLKLDTDLKVGDTVKPMDIVAYDKASYSDNIGTGENISYNLGTLAKTAILVTDEGYEDSCIVSEWMSKAMSSDIVVKKEVVLPKDTNILSIVKKGQPIQEGENLILFQNTFDEDEMNALIKTLADDEEIVSDLGRIPIKSKNTGIVQDIKVYRTVEKEELSPSLKKIVSSYEANVNKLKKAAKGTNNESIASSDFGATEKLPPMGKLKDTSDGVKIEFYIKYRDDFSIGDKLVVQSALKGVAKDIFPEGQEPYSEYRKDEPIDIFLSTLSVTGRMVCSIEVSGGINKILIELARQVKDIMGIPYPMNVHGKDQTFD